MGKVKHVPRTGNFIDTWVNENGELHSCDHPSVYDDSDGSFAWHKNGVLHRLDGPALYGLCDSDILDGDDYFFVWSYHWYVNGTLCRNAKQFQNLSGVSNEEIFRLTLIYGEIGCNCSPPEDYEKWVLEGGKLHRFIR